MALEHSGLKASGGEVLVTGAGGGVGSVAVTLLAARGYKVAASTGRPELHSYLDGLGASAIIERSELEASCADDATERWGGRDRFRRRTDAGVRHCGHSGSTARLWPVGWAGGAEFSTTGFPFILRNVFPLLGINSSASPKPTRIRAWTRLANELPGDKLDSITAVEPMSKIRELRRTNPCRRNSWPRGD